MKLKEIFDQLTYGELSQLRIGGEEAGVISENNYERVLSHINLGLIALHKRFALKEGRVILKLLEGMDTYTIQSNFAMNNTRSRSTVRYLLDTMGHPFTDDIQKIEQVLTDSGIELGLNDGANAYAVSTPSALALRVPTILLPGAPDTSELPDYLRTKNLVLVYRASHAKLSVGMGFFDPARVEVELPYAYLEPLLFYVASRVNNPIGLTNEFNASNNYYAKYEAACKELERVNLDVDLGSQGSNFQRNGWV